MVTPDPEPFWPDIASVIGYNEEQIADGWPEMEFPVRIIPDMLDVLEDHQELALGFLRAVAAGLLGLYDLAGDRTVALSSQP